MNARDIELRIVKYFNPRVNVIVPNVYWGLGLNYEMDMAVITKARYLYEIEIKITAADIKADLKKRNQHSSKLAKLLYFAVPEELQDNPHIPARAGIISIGKYTGVTKCPETNKLARKLNDREYMEIMRLGCMRIWTLKERLKDRENYIKILKAPGPEKEER